MEPATATTARTWMDYPQASEYTGLERTTLYRAVRRGELRAGGAGRAVRFEKGELDRWMRSGGTGEK